MQHSYLIVWVGSWETEQNHLSKLACRTDAIRFSFHLSIYLFIAFFRRTEGSARRTRSVSNAGGWGGWSAKKMYSKRWVLVKNGSSLVQLCSDEFVDKSLADGIGWKERTARNIGWHFPGRRIIWELIINNSITFFVGPLGIMISKDSEIEHVCRIMCKKFASCCYFSRRLRRAKLPTWKDLLSCYTTYIRPVEKHECLVFYAALLQ